jgi:hypothetical protein
MSTRLYEHPIFLEHSEAPQASEDAVLLAHPEEHLFAVMRQVPEEEGEINKLEADTYASQKSFQAALTGIGGAMAAVDDVFTGKADNVFVASRPPGHHAEKSKAMGFCFFNNAAIAARHAQRRHGAERVAIVDWDVHHGNGTQDIFWDDPSCCTARRTRCRSIPARRQERDRRARHHRQRAAARRRRQRPFREAFKAGSAALERLPAGPDHHLGRLRRASPRSASADQSGRRGFRLGDRAAARGGRQKCLQPGRQPSGRRL